jgi:hypothetical protein
LRDLKFTTDPPPKDPVAAAAAAAAAGEALAAGVGGQPNPADKEGAREHFGLLYIKFIQIFKKLAESYDQMTHPQKRRVLRLLLEGTMGRLLELKGVLVDLECTDYNFFDDILADVKLTPEDIEIPTPNYFRRENATQIKEREKILEDLSAATLDPRVKEPEPEPEPMSVEQAIRLIQIHERARQGRLRAKFMQDIRAQEERERRARENPDASKVMNKRQAVIILQKYTRGWLTRRHVWQQVEKDNLFIGMEMPPPLSKKVNPILKLQKAVDTRHVMQQQYEQTYQAALLNIRKKISQVEGPDMRENMCDEIREWFVACRDQTGSFPEFPDEADLGSKKIFDPPEPEAPAADGDDDDGGKGKKGKKDKKKKSDKKGKGKKGKKGKGDDDDEGPAAFPASVFGELAQAGSEEFNRVWKRNQADKANLHQKHDSEMIKRDKRLEVEDELRLEVDELMREELKNLKAAVEGGGKKGKKEKKAKKSKKDKKGKKGKKEKDLTEGRTPESLYKELVEEHLVKKVSAVKMADFMGQYSHLARHKLAKDTEPDPSYADIRRVLTVYGILPLGSMTVHATQPNHIKSVLLVGPPGVGKKTLVNAVAHELGATFFDITPRNTAGKYTGKKIDGVEGLIHKVFKMAKLYQPSVIWIGDACSVHAKKKNKDDELDSTRMKKELPKAMKKLAKGERVLVLGTDEKPEEADMKALTGVYDKILMIPHPDYGSRLMLWRNTLMREGCTHVHLASPTLDLSSLAKISDGYTAGDITKVSRQVLTARRIQTLAYKPLSASEFVPSLARLDPVDPEQELEYKNWQLKTPMGKKRAALKAPPDDDDGGGKKKGKKGSGKKKKKKK